MSLFNWIWDFDQDGKIKQLSDEIEALQQRIEILEMWIRYLQEKEEQS